LKDPLKKAKQDLLVPAMKSVRVATTRMEARTGVVQFCSEYSIAEHLAKPSDAD